jgi:hypothetical protein
MLRLRDPRVPVAEDLRLGVPGEEDENALLTPARDVVLLERLFPGIGGNSVDVEIDRRAPCEAVTRYSFEPGPHQFEVGSMGDG